MTIHARPTTYNGIQMRSRLEAAFAAILDDTDCTWQYEPRCFASPQGQYLPDFLVNDKSYIEIKPPVADFDAALDRMHIILASEPDVTLRVVSGTQGEPWKTERTCKPCHASQCECPRQRKPCDTTCGCPHYPCDRCGDTSTWHVLISKRDPKSTGAYESSLCENCFRWDYEGDFLEEHQRFDIAKRQITALGYAIPSALPPEETTAAGRRRLREGLTARQCDSCNKDATQITYASGLPPEQGALYLCDICMAQQEQHVPREGAAAAARRQLAARTGSGNGTL